LRLGSCNAAETASLGLFEMIVDSLLQEHPGNGLYISPDAARWFEALVGDSLIPDPVAWG
jgi:hypothetical protein